MAVNAVRRPVTALHRLALVGNDSTRFADRRAKDHPNRENEAMNVVSDSRQGRPSPDEFGADDLPTGETFDAELLGRRYLTEDAREPRRFLPPPKIHTRQEAVPPREPESRLSKVAKLAGLTTAGTLLVGAVVASSMVTRERTEQTGRSTPTPPAITGAAALGGFALPDSPRQRHHSSPSSARTTTPGTAGRSQPSQTPPATSDTESPGDVPTTQSNSTSSSSSTSSTGSTSSTPNSEKIAMVRKFYQRMGSQQPQSALAMLAPDLIGDQRDELLRAFSSMIEVDVKDIQVQPDGSVRATVDIVQRDGTRLRVTQALELTQDVIEQAVLLSLNLL